VTKLISKKITITGKVQGVGYRYWLQKICIKNKIVGWVLNKNNGEVEATFCNVDENIFKDILSDCFLGPSKSMVNNILVEDTATPQTPLSFEIRK
jgi:acylphosphatase